MITILEPWSNSPKACPILEPWSIYRESDHFNQGRGMDRRIAAKTPYTQVDPKPSKSHKGHNKKTTFLNPFRFHFLISLVDQGSRIGRSSNLRPGFEPWSHFQQMITILEPWSYSPKACPIFEPWSRFQTFQKRDQGSGNKTHKLFQGRVKAKFAETLNLPDTYWRWCEQFGKL